MDGEPYGHDYPFSRLSRIFLTLQSLLTMHCFLYILTSKRVLLLSYCHLLLMKGGGGVQSQIEIAKVILPYEGGVSIRPFQRKYVCSSDLFFNFWMQNTFPTYQKGVYIIPRCVWQCGRALGTYVQLQP